MGEPPALERLLRRDRAITVAGLAALTLLAWIYIVTGAGMGLSAWDMTTLSLFPHKAAQPMAPMAGMQMDGMAARPAAWTPAAWALTIAMWWTMMVAMMAPSAAPTILLYGKVRSHAVAQGRAGVGLAQTWAFAAGYLLVWLGFSVAAAGLHWGLARTGLLSAAMMGSQSRWLSAAVLAAAGLYQLTPLQNLCLSHCRSPAGFLSRHWRPGVPGAVRLGVLHGAFCVGCCWMLMALLFVGGVMNLAWIAALTLLILAEKLVPGGPWIARATGVALLAWAAATLLA
ncbi:MAG: putative metal-binding integral rane protein [Phenylobacterium sp.]|nr:putative metal-binding integral rane protein [Phenylobacterium sp.]